MLRFAGARCPDPRIYNHPASAEVACAVVGEGPLPAHYIFVFEHPDEDCEGRTHELSSLSEYVDPLTYPLIHICGTLGYSTALRVVSEEGVAGRRISMKDFYQHRIMQRFAATDGVVELPHGAGRLFQQYLVDAYTKVESERLEWVRRNQDKLRMG